MLFIGVALLVAVGVALLVNADVGHMVGLTPDQTAQALPLLAILLVVVAAVFSRRRPLSELVGGVLLWIGIFGVAVIGYTYRDELQNVASRVAGEFSPGVAVVDGGSASFRRGLGGHFQVNAEINGEPVSLIFDTGASAVVLTARDARDAGIDTDQLDYEVPVSTANGTGRAASILLDHVQVGSIARDHVRAFVAEPGALETSLLGMTFLDTLSSFAVKGNSLELQD